MNVNGSLLSILDLFSSYNVFCLYVVKPFQNVPITRMVWSVKNCVVTVATGNHVITWTEAVHTDVTQGCMEINVTWVIGDQVFFQHFLHKVCHI